MSAPLFQSELVPIETARQKSVDGWLRLQSADDFRNHLIAKARWHAQNAAEKAVQAVECPRMETAAAEELREARKYLMTLEVFDQLRESGEPFKTIKS